MSDLASWDFNAWDSFFKGIPNMAKTDYSTEIGGYKKNHQVYTHKWIVVHGGLTVQSIFYGPFNESNQAHKWADENLNLEKYGYEVVPMRQVTNE